MAEDVAKPVPDPTILTTEQLLRTVAELDKRIQTARDDDKQLFQVQVDCLRRELAITERSRVELKNDNEKALTTALTAAEKAVQTALAAAEKARDQQIIASQLATSKAENAFVEQLAQQGATTAAEFANLRALVNAQKELLSEERALGRGRTEQSTANRDLNTDKRGNNSITIAVIGIGLTVIGTLVAVTNIVLSRLP